MLEFLTQRPAKSWQEPEAERPAQLCLYVNSFGFESEGSVLDNHCCSPESRLAARSTEGSRSFQSKSGTVTEFSGLIAV